jgi:uncharacterized repeat protein (TIGR01451 family)
MNMHLNSQTGRLLAALALPLLALCLLCLALGFAQPVHSQGATSLPAAENAVGAEPGVTSTPTPCPYEGKSDPPPGQIARLIGDDEILLSYRWGPSPRGLHNLILNDVNGSLQASTRETTQSQIDEVSWMANAASDLNGDHHAEVLTAWKDHSQHLGAMAFPIGTNALSTDNLDWINTNTRTSGDAVADVDVTAGNLDATDAPDEAVIAFRDHYEDLHFQVLNGSTTGYFATADNPPDAYDVNSLQWLWDSNERGNMHHTAVATGDVNKDGADEIVTAFKDSGNDLQVMVVKYKAPSTFTVLHNYDSYSATPKFDTVADTDDGFANKRPIDVAVGDVDGDAQDEIVVAFRYGNGDTGEIQLLIEDVKSINADGTLVMNAYVTKQIDLKGSHYNYAANDVSVSVADLDGDDHAEIALGYTLLYWNKDTYSEIKWQHWLVTYEYLREGSPEWQVPCGATGSSCLVARPGSWNSSSKEVPSGRPETDPQSIVSVSTGDLDQDGMAEIALAHLDFSNNDYLQVVTFDADTGLSKRSAYTVNASMWEFAVAMGDYDGDSVWGTYNGHCYSKADAIVQAVIHAPPYWPEEHGLNGCDNAYGTMAGFGTNVTVGGSHGGTTETTIGGSATVDAGIGPIHPSFTSEWEHTTATTTEVVTETLVGTETETNPPLTTKSDVSYETVKIIESPNWCYEYTTDKVGTIPVCLPRSGLISQEGKRIKWWYKYGPSAYPDTWVPVGANLAEGRAASQSSDYASETPPGTAVAGWAVDGNTNGDFARGSVASTSYDLYAWWQVDLGGLQWLDAVQLWNRTDCCSDRLKNFYVLVTEHSEWPSNCTVGGVESAPSCNCGDPACMKDQPDVSFTNYIIGSVGVSVTIPVSGYGRLVRIQLDHRDFLHMAEVQVYGTPGTPDRWPKVAPAGTVGSGDSFTLTWRDERYPTDERKQQVSGSLYYVYSDKLAKLVSGPGGSGDHFDIEQGSEQGYVTESGDAVKYSVGMEVKFRKAKTGDEASKEISQKQSNGTTWGTELEFSGDVEGMPTDAPEALKYYYAPYVWQQEAMSVGGGKQQFLVLDYWVPDPVNVIPDPMPEPDLCPEEGLSSSLLTAPKAPLIESPTHPDPATWYNSNTATFTWVQPPGDPVVETYHWYLDQNPDTIPAGADLGLTSTYTYRGLQDGIWYLHVRARNDDREWGQTGHRMIRVDAKPPQVTLALDPPNPTGDGGWYVSPVSVSVSAIDATGSGVASVEVSTDGVAWQTYTAPLVLSADTPGATVYARATDAVGNVSTPVSTTVKIDRTPPNSHVDGGVGPGAWVAEVIANPAGNDELALAGAVADDLSGRAGIDHQYDGVDWTGSTTFGSWHPFPGRPQIEVNWYYTPTHQIGAGYHIFTGQAFDVAGNREAEYEIGRVLWLPKASPDIAGSSLTASPAMIRPGAVVTFTLVARNAGWQEAHVSVVDTLPEGLTPILDALTSDASYDAETRALTWPAGLLWPGQSVQRTFQARPDAGLGATSLKNHATFHAFWPNTDLLPEDERQQFKDREQTVVATATVVVDPNLPAGADVTPPWVTLAQPYEQVVEGSEISLAIQAAPDATRMYVREWAPDPATGAWIVKRNSGWIKYSANYTWGLSSGQGVKYVGVWVADGAGNISTLDEHSLIFVNRMDASQSLGDRQRVQYRGLLQGGEWISGILATVSGDPNVYVWKPRNAFWPDRLFNEAVLPGQVETFSNRFRLEGGRYLLEVQAVGASEYELSLTRQGGVMAIANGAALEEPLPPHPLTVSDPLSAGQVGPAMTLQTKNYLPMMFRNKLQVSTVPEVVDLLAEVLGQIPAK